MSAALTPPAAGGEPIGETELREAIHAARAQHRAGAGAVLDILIRGGGADQSRLLASLPERAGVAVLQTSADLRPDFTLWDAGSARQARCVVLRNAAGEVFAAAEDPWDELLLQRIARRIGLQPAAAAVTRAALQGWLGESSAVATDAAHGNDGNSGAADGPIVQFVDQALLKGFTGGASDVHFECDRSGVTVKHRLDGVMAHFARLDSAAAAQEVISRIKVLAQLDITERRLPPVNERKGLTFAKGLRSILRHDPDRILVGEIRDAETAEIAVQSALTGHLVFTTVHANSVADIIGRFRHFDLDMFGFMSSLNGVVVQRLVRRLCPHCAGERVASDDETRWFERAGRAGVMHVPVPVGCGECHGAGYKGRFVLAEVHVVDDVLRDHVTEGSPLSAIKTHARESGVESLIVQAARHVAEGRTTVEEVKRVVGWL